MSAAALMLIPSLLQAGLGAAQYFGGRKMTRQETPEYQIPQALTDMGQMQRGQMYADMPGAETMRQDVRATTADSLRSAERYGYIDPNIVGQAYSGQQAGLRDIGVRSSQHKVQERDRHYGIQGAIAQEQGRAWDWNEAMPFQYQQAAGSALMGSGIQNVWGGVSSAGDFMAQRQMMQGMGYDVPNWFGTGSGFFGGGQPAKTGYVGNTGMGHIQNFLGQYLNM